MIAPLTFCLLLVTPSASAFVPQSVLTTGSSFVYKPKASASHSKTSALWLGAFDYSADLSGKGKLTVSYTSDEPTPTPVEPLPQVFPGIGLPPYEPEPPRIKNTFTNAQVEMYGVSSQVILSPAGIIGKSKSDENSLDVARNIAMDINKLAMDIPDPSSYNFFGNDDYSTTLRLLLKSNPFMAPALTELPNGEGFEVKTFDPNLKTPPTLYQTILSTLNGVGHRVNVQFDAKMESITGWEMYDDISGEKKDVDEELAVTSAIYNIVFFASCVHASIHVLHYLYTAAFQVASKDFPEMNEWANDYAKNIPWKYKQVGELLLTDPLNQLAILTGGSGFGSSQAVRFILKKMLQNWGMRPTAEGFYLDCMMNIPKEKIGKGGVVLEEFMKHYNLVAPFAEEASDALKKIDSKKHAAAEKELGSYLNRCGEFTSNLSTIDEWVQMVAITGVMHGGTLSYTRLLAMPKILRWRNFVSPSWDFPDAFILLGAIGTIVGMEDGRHVMTDSEGPTSQSAEPLMRVLKEYDGKATNLKERYQKKLIKSDEFEDFGWILSDFCLDDFDGKQLTIATYV